MIYYTINESGSVELREDSAIEIPANGVSLTHLEYISLQRSETTIVDGVIVPYVAPAKPS